MNLIENALKYSPPAEPVRVQVGGDAVRGARARDRPRARASPAEERERIFEPFQRGAAQRRRRGAGLGLAIARGFAEANGGRVWVESRRGPGRDVRARAARRAGRGARRERRRAILVVDDEQQILRALRTSLRGAGYEVETAETAEARARGRGDAAARGGDPRPRAARTAPASTSAASCARGARRR